MKLSRVFVLLVSGILLAAACTTAPEPVGFQPEILPLPADPSDYAPHIELCGDGNSGR